MISLRESLQEMVEATAAKALTGNGTSEGQHAIIRMTLLLSMLEKLDAGGGLRGLRDDSDFRVRREQ